MDSSTISLWTGPFPKKEGLVSFSIILIKEIPILNANSLYLGNAASDLELPCLQRFHLWDARLNGLTGHNEPGHFLPDSLSTKRRFSCASWSVCFSPEEILCPLLPTDSPAKTDQTARMYRLICVFTKRTRNLVGLLSVKIF